MEYSCINILWSKYFMENTDGVGFSWYGTYTFSSFNASKCMIALKNFY